MKEPRTKPYLPHVAELGEFYDDGELRDAVSQHPELRGNRQMNDLCIKHAAIGAVERMLIAEVIVHPGRRLVDIAKDMMMDRSGLFDWSYYLAKAKILDRTKVGGFVFLAPGPRCGEVGLDVEAAAALITFRVANPEYWEPVSYLARHWGWFGEIPKRVESDGYDFGYDSDEDIEEIVKQL